MNGVHRVWIEGHCIDQKPPAGKELESKYKSSLNITLKITILTRTPANIDDTVFRWYSGLNQRQLDRLSQIAIVSVVLLLKIYVFL